VSPLQEIHIHEVVHTRFPFWSRAVLIHCSKVSSFWKTPWLPQSEVSVTLHGSMLPEARYPSTWVPRTSSHPVPTDRAPPEAL